MKSQGLRSALVKDIGAAKASGVGAAKANDVGAAKVWRRRSSA